MTKGDGELLLHRRVPFDKRRPKLVEGSWLSGESLATLTCLARGRHRQVWSVPWRPRLILQRSVAASAAPVGALADWNSEDASRRKLCLARAPHTIREGACAPRARSTISGRFTLKTGGRIPKSAMGQTGWRKKSEPPAASFDQTAGATSGRFPATPPITRRGTMQGRQRPVLAGAQGIDSTVRRLAFALPAAQGPLGRAGIDFGVVGILAE